MRAGPGPRRAAEPAGRKNDRVAPESSGRSISTRAGARSGSPTPFRIRRKASRTTSATSGSRGTSSRPCRAVTDWHRRVEIYGKVSAVGERTYGTRPTMFGDDVSSFQVEDLSFGWRSGKSIGSARTPGLHRRTRFIHDRPGLLLWTAHLRAAAAADTGPTRERPFSSPRSVVCTPGHHTGEGFYLDKDELPESDTGTRLWCELRVQPGEHSTLGATYMEVRRSGAPNGMG